MYIMETAKTNLDAIITSLLENYPESEVADEIEFAFRGQPNPDGSQWRLNINTFRSLLKEMSNKLGLEIEEPTIMLTINTHDHRRVRITDIELMKQYCSSDRLEVTDASDILYERKTRLSAPVDLPYSLRLRYASERPITDPTERKQLASDVSKVPNQENPIKTYRHAKRYSIIHPDKLGENGQIRLDFTAVKTGSGISFRNAKILGTAGAKTPELYEVELEITGVTREELESEEVQTVIRSFLEPLVMHLHGGITLVTDTELLNGMTSYVQLCHSALGLPEPENELTELSQDTLNKLMDYYVAPNIVSMSRRNLIDKHMIKNYVFTDKADGQRCLLYIDANGKCFLLSKDSVFMLSQRKNKLTGHRNLVADQQATTYLNITATEAIVPDETIKLKKGDAVRTETRSYKNSICDGELIHIDGKVYFKTFDIIVHQGESLIEQDFTDRQSVFDKLKLNHEDVFYISPKTFVEYTLEKFQAYANQELEVVRDKKSQAIISLQYKHEPYQLDGLVFQPKAGEESYYPKPVAGRTKNWFSVYKWKPLHHLTVDLELSYTGRSPPEVNKKTTVFDSEGLNEIEYVFASYNAYSRDKGLVKSEYPCYADMSTGVPRTVSDEDGTPGEPITNHSIVECRLSHSHGTYWEPVRIRYDKSTPNHYRTYTNTLISITEEPITLDNLGKPEGGFGGVRKYKVTKINRELSNSIMVRYAMQIRGDITILDLASGDAKSGGAWLNIKKGKERTGSSDVVNVIGVDIQSLDKAVQYMSAKFNRDADGGFRVNTKFVQADMTMPLHENPELTPYLFQAHTRNIVTCNFAIQHAMGSEKNFRLFLINVSRNLAKGGFFIGSYMNSQKIIDLFNSGTKSNKHGNLLVKGNEMSYKTGGETLWKIHRAFTGAPDVLENHSILVDFIGLMQNQLEYLIDMDNSRIKEIMLEYQLEPVAHTSFNEIAETNSVDLSDLDIGEKYWLGLHYAFVFRRTKKEVNYMVKLNEIKQMKSVLPANQSIPVKVKTTNAVSEKSSINKPGSSVKPGSGVKKPGSIVKKPMRITNPLPPPPASDTGPSDTGSSATAKPKISVKKKLSIKKK